MELFDQHLEGQVLVCVGAEGGLAHAAEQLAEAGVAGQVCAQHERVDEEADQRLQLCAAATGDRSADDDVLLAAVAGKERLEAGEQDHEQGGVLAAAERAQPVDQRRRQRERVRSTAIVLHRRPRPVGRQLQHRQALQTLPPVAELPLQQLPLQPAALPEREIRILHRQLRQRRPPPQRKRLVQLRQLLKQQPDRPAVANNVMHRQQEDPVGRPQP